MSDDVPRYSAAIQQLFVRHGDVFVARKVQFSIRSHNYSRDNSHQNHLGFFQLVCLVNLSFIVDASGDVCIAASLSVKRSDDRAKKSGGEFFLFKMFHLRYRVEFHSTDVATNTLLDVLDEFVFPQKSG